MTKNVLIGERFNGEDRPMWNIIVGTDPAAWLEIAVRLGAFNDYRSRLKLADIGLRYNVPAWVSRSRGEAVIKYDESHVNVHHRFNMLPPSPHAGEWDKRLARRVACTFAEFLVDYDVTFLCGRRVCDAFGIPRGPFPSRWAVVDHGDSCTFEVLDSEETADNMIVCLPHPSGQSRWWNDALNIMTTRAMVQWLGVTQ